MNENNKKAIEYAELLKEYCEKRCQCEDENGHDCIFLDGYLGECTLRRHPCDWGIPSLKPTISEDEKSILRNIDEKFKWIANHKESGSSVFVNEPNRINDGDWFDPCDIYALCLRILFPNLFNFDINGKWLIADLLKE